MPKGRIQIRLSEDVAAILNEHGRSNDAPGDSRLTRTQIIETAVRVYDFIGGFRPGFDLTSIIRFATARANDKTNEANPCPEPAPEQQVKADRGKSGVRANRDWMAEHAGEYEGWLALKDGQLLGNAATIEALQEICGIGDFRNTGITVTQGWKQQPPVRAERKKARAGRKAELVEGVKAAQPKKRILVPSGADGVSIAIARSTQSEREALRPHSFHSGTAPIPGCAECMAMVAK